MTTPAGRPRRLIHDEFGLRDIVDQLDRPSDLVERDFALVSIAAQLVQDYGAELCFKGGFVLRHVYGHERFSKDIDATRRLPPKHKFDAEEVAQSLRSAGMRNLLEIDPGSPRTDSGRSLDFDQIRFRGPLGRGSVALEVSYREAVIDPPDMVTIGDPYYEPFEVPVMAINEIVAEKMRTLCQRQRPTDLADLAMILDGRHEGVDDDSIVRLAVRKFEIVRGGDRLARITENIDAMAHTYGTAVRGLAPDAPDFATARELVLKRITGLIP